jgi:hypothetical protein
MRRLVFVIALLAMLAVGSGSAGFLHSLHHLHDATSSGPADSKHDESKCVIHAQLRAPMVSGGYVPLLVSVGLFVAFLTLLAQAPAVQSVHVRLDCRGPPVCSSMSA